MYNRKKESWAVRGFELSRAPPSSSSIVRVALVALSLAIHREPGSAFTEDIFTRDTIPRSFRLYEKEVSAAVPATGRWYCVCRVGFLGNNK